MSRYKQGDRVLWTKWDKSAQHAATVIDGCNWRGNIEIITDEPWRSDDDGRRGTYYPRLVEIDNRDLTPLTRDGSSTTEPLPLF